MIANYFRDQAGVGGWRSLPQHLYAYVIMESNLFEFRRVTTSLYAIGYR
jgi:hypothetical protein